MKRLILVVAIMVLVAAGAQAGPIPNLNWGSQINASQCNADGDLVVNVTMQVSGDIDSGVAGNYWANSSYNKTVQIWTTATPNVYCARVMYLGKFVAVAGVSPGGTGTLLGGEKGSFEGGYWATITGTLLSPPAWRTNGHVGAINFGCNASTGDCTNRSSWVGQYFASGYTFTYGWWGWTYHGGKNGSWVNSSDATTGDISQ